MTYMAGAEVPQTSVATGGGPPVTVEFLRWTAFLDTAYQKGQRAGFSEAQAEVLVRNRKARIISRAGE